MHTWLPQGGGRIWPPRWLSAIESHGHRRWENGPSDSEAIKPLHRYDLLSVRHMYLIVPLKSRDKQINTDKLLVFLKILHSTFFMN